MKANSYYGPPRSDERDIQRFWAGVEKSDTCWNWTRYCAPNGYGMIQIKGRPRSVHRFSYVLHHGPVPEGLVVHHICNNRRCVRPDHLLAVTQQENVLAYTTTITHCPKGHEYSKENTYYESNTRSPGTMRRCRTCTLAQKALARKERNGRRSQP